MKLKAIVLLAALLAMPASADQDGLTAKGVTPSTAPERVLSSDPLDFHACVERAVSGRNRARATLTKEGGEKWCAENGYTVGVPNHLQLRFPRKDPLDFLSCVKRGLARPGNSVSETDIGGWCVRNGYTVNAPPEALARAYSHKGCVESGMRQGHDMGISSEWCWRNGYRYTGR